ncbi:WecB/TagA/CpsF family glycosyltransferase [Ramlibacter sp. AW1]|uniref:WecB/TagA/CpsF family glycosyltransferase n=1 Tax=Ramlibacter aurantiacus TaxID=2801330 RepID=A0A937D5R3_9BURK|nr:WecB/TagA/CpsF family glycosyltransferase [Ramlibacter aurantiacus]MBL0420188.1 WecB/TagA/CpsF family glycosyltransferase [Ramlibacter aurantiacus]
MRLAAAPPGDWLPRWQQLVCAIARVHSEHGERQLLDWLCQPEEPVVVAFVNAHAMNSAAVSAHFFEALMSADVVLRDGIGMALLMKLLNQRPGLNLNGTDLIPKLMRCYAGGTIALFGTQEPWLSRARQAVLREVAPGSACVVAHGFHDTASYVRLAAMHRPRLIVLGMGMPRQEEVAVVLRAALGFPCVIVCGGAIIDFLGNKTPRAPRWMRRLGLEWLYRLGREPRRLFHRYVVGNPVFLRRSLRLAAHSLCQERPSGQTV